MEIRPCIIGPDLSISSDIVYSIIDGPGLPMLGIKGGSWETTLLLGEYREIALGMDLIMPMTLQGTTGKNEADLSLNLTEEQRNMKGSFCGLFGSYFIYPIESGFWVKGTNGKYLLDMRINATGNYTKVFGTIGNDKIEITINMITETTILVRGFHGSQKIEINVIYGNEGIKIKGTHGPHFLDYTVTAGEDRVTTKGITQDGFVNYDMVLEDESSVRIKGKPGKLEADYMLNIYGNGIAVKGDVGLFKADYAFVLGQLDGESE
ncbi:MAG: hypothetical protein LWY06_00315 [Firmicutes bacterium]|nr:hypothetical protein [Bacillota bacterium]